MAASSVRVFPVGPEPSLCPWTRPRSALAFCRRPLVSRQSQGCASVTLPRRRTGAPRYAAQSQTAEVPPVDRDEQLKDAARSGDFATVKELVAAGGIDINVPSAARSGWTALQLAAFYGHTDVTSFLIESGADTEVCNGSGNTALQLACLKGHVDIARALLDAGADIEHESHDKGSVMDYAQEWGGESMVDFLLLYAAKQAYNLRDST